MEILGNQRACKRGEKKSKRCKQTSSVSNSRACRQQLQGHGFDSQGKCELIKCVLLNAKQFALDKSICQMTMYKCKCKYCDAPCLFLDCLHHDVNYHISCYNAFWLSSQWKRRLVHDTGCGTSTTSEEHGCELQHLQLSASPHLPLTNPFKEKPGKVMANNRRSHS